MGRKITTGADRFTVVNGWHVLSVGYKQTASGNRGPQRFYLSRVNNDPKGLEADRIAAARREQWATLKAAGHEVWPASLLDTLGDEAGATAGAAGTGQTGQGIATPAAGVVIGSIGNVVGSIGQAETVAAAAAIYLAEHYVRAKHMTALTARYRLESAIGFLGAERPLRLVDEAAIGKAINTICSRPFSRPSGSKSLVAKRMEREGKAAVAADEPKPTRISVVQAKHLLASLKRFLIWADETERFERPRRFDKLFKALPIVTDDERRERSAKLTTGREVERFEIAELTTLYKYATERQRLWLLLMLNCGFANEELNDLHCDEIHGLETPSPYIARIRKKTIRFDRANDGVYAKWSLWPETAKLLKQFKAADGYALLTHHGNRLIEATTSGRKDAVYVSWQWLYKRVRKQTELPRWLAPKYVRKTVAHLVRSMPDGGTDLADMLLSHADAGIITAYAGRDWTRLNDCLMKLREMLAPMFEAAGKSKRAA